MKTENDPVNSLMERYGAIPPFMLFLRKVPTDALDVLRKRKTVTCARLNSGSYHIKRDYKPLSMLDLRGALLHEMVSAI